MYVRRLLYFPYSDIVISLLLGFGLATMFRAECKDKKECIDFRAPPLKDFNEKSFKLEDGKCYTFTPTLSKCDPTKKIVRFS
jgi:hypothetical protein